jgi:hypothetical protein
MASLGIPALEMILKKGIRNVLQRSGVSELNAVIQRNGFSTTILSIESAAHQVYLEEERIAVMNLLKARGVPAEEAELVSEVFIGEDLVTRIANTRRARGGLTSEAIVREVLAALGIPCEKSNVKVGGYRPDISVPSNELLRRTPSKAVAISVKRTLRERWAEDIDVFSNFENGKFVLLIPDPDFNESKARDMVSRGMRAVYLNDDLYERSRSFVTKEFRRQSELPNDILAITGTRQQRLA